jgi:hypothetical protein
MRPRKTHAERGDVNADIQDISWSRAGASTSQADLRLPVRPSQMPVGQAAFAQLRGHAVEHGIVMGDTIPARDPHQFTGQLRHRVLILKGRPSGVDDPPSPTCDVQGLSS